MVAPPAFFEQPPQEEILRRRIVGLDPNNPINDPNSPWGEQQRTLLSSMSPDAIKNIYMQLRGISGPAANAVDYGSDMINSIMNLQNPSLGLRPVLGGGGNPPGLPPELANFRGPIIDPYFDPVTGRPAPPPNYVDSAIGLPGLGDVGGKKDFLDRLNSASPEQRNSLFTLLKSSGMLPSGWGDTAPQYISKASSDYPRLGMGNAIGVDYHDPDDVPPKTWEDLLNLLGGGGGDLPAYPPGYVGPPGVPIDPRRYLNEPGLPIQFGSANRPPVLGGGGGSTMVGTTPDGYAKVGTPDGQNGLFLGPTGGGGGAPVNVAQLNPNSLNGLSDSQLLDAASQLGINTDFFGGNNVTLDPQVQAMVSQAYQAQRERGTGDLRRAAMEAAGARGLNFTDTPIGEPYLRSLSNLLSGLGSGEAQALLNMNENRFNTNEQTRRFQAEQSRLADVQQQGFLGNMLDFQRQLEQNAFNNRLNLATLAGNLGRGFPTNTTTTQGQTGFNPSIFQSALQGIGAGLQGIAGLLFPSSPTQGSTQPTGSNGLSPGFSNLLPGLNFGINY